MVVGGGLSGAHRRADRIVERRRRRVRRPVEVACPRSQGPGRRRPSGRDRRRTASRSRAGPTRSSPTSRGAWTSAERLGLGDQLIGTDPQHRRSFVVREGRLMPVPEGFVLMAPNRLGPLADDARSSRGAGKLRMLMDLVLPAAGRRRRREPRLVRPAPAGPRGAGAAGAAAGRRHLHGRPERAEPEGDAARSSWRWSASTAA